MRRGCIPATHIVALAQEMQLAMTEVYEVATFYHHFDIVDTNESPPPPITVRVCETLSCHMAGAQRAARRAERAGGPTFAWSARRASAAASTRRPLSSGATLSTRRRRGKSQAVSPPGTSRPPLPQRSPTPTIARAAATRRWLDCVNGNRDVESVRRTMDDSALARAGRRRASPRAASGGSSAPSRRRG